MLLLLFGSVLDDIVADDVGLEREAERRAGIGDLLVDDRIIAEVETQPAILLGHGRTQHPDLAGLGPDRLVDDSRLFPFGDVRHRFLLQEAAHRLAEGLMVLVIGEAAGNGVEHVFLSCIF